MCESEPILGSTLQYPVNTTYNTFSYWIKNFSNSQFAYFFVIPLYVEVGGIQGPFQAFGVGSTQTLFLYLKLFEIYNTCEWNSLLIKGLYKVEHVIRQIVAA